MVSITTRAAVFSSIGILGLRSVEPGRPPSGSTRLAQIAQTCSARLGCARLGSAASGRARLRLAGSSSARLGLAASGLATRSSARLGRAALSGTTDSCTTGCTAISCCATTLSCTAIGSTVGHCRTRCGTARGLRTGAGCERHPAHNCKKTGQFCFLHRFNPSKARCGDLSPQVCHTPTADLEPTDASLPDHTPAHFRPIGTGTRGTQHKLRPGRHSGYRRMSFFITDQMGGRSPASPMLASLPLADWSGIIPA